MSWRCFFSHDWEHREIHPDRDKEYGYKQVCKRCNTLGDKVRPAGFEENTTEIEFGVDNE